MLNKTIFISSTWEDLIPHRELVIKVLNRLHCPIEAMEHNGAFPLPPKQWSIMHVRKSDIYIGIFGVRYGTIDIETGKSITELEYDVAEELNIPKFIYIIDEEHHQILPKFREEDIKQDKLQKLKSRFKTPITYKPFTSAEDLAKSVALDLVSYFQDEEEILFNLKKPLKYVNNIENLKKQIQQVLKISSDNTSLSNEIESLIIASELGNGNSEILSDIVSFDPYIEKRVLELISIQNEIGNIIATELLLCNNPFIIRLLTILAGRLRENKCTEAICKNVLYGYYFEKIIKESRQSVHPYYEVARRSLSSMPYEGIETIKKYLEIARDKKKWKAKKIFEYALVKIVKNTI